jgi:glycosyltransferase involved in cell wall biosynthesis
MRLALTHAYSWPEVRRGAERIIDELSRALTGRGHDVTVFTSGWREAAAGGSDVTTVRVRRIFRSEHRHELDFGRRLVPRLLLAGRFDAVHSLGPPDCVASIRASRLLGHRTVYTNLGLPFHWAWDARHDGRAHQRVVRDVDVYGCMSRFALDALAHDYGRQGTLTPGGVDTAQFKPAPRRTDQPTVLFSGALYEERKGLSTLMAAIDLLLPLIPKLRLWVSGPGDPRGLLAGAPARVRDRIDVLPIGSPKGLADRYGEAWTTALPSKNDSFGMVLIESLACGTPVVASTHSALPELVAPGLTGALCEPDDPASVARALGETIELAGDPATAAACREAAARYDWQTGVAPLMERIYAGD